MPNSVLWVFLIVVWLFVLVPMVLRGRPEARKSTAAAAQTRVVHRGGSRSAATRRRAAQARSTRAESVAKRLAETTAPTVAESDDEIVDAEIVEDETAEVAETTVDDVVDVDVDEAAEVDEAADQDGSAADDIAAEKDTAEGDAVEDGAADEVTRSAADTPLDVTDVFEPVEVDVVDIDEAQAARADADQTNVEAPRVEAPRASGEAFDILDDEDDHRDADDPAPAPTAREMRGTGGYGPGLAQARDDAAFRERRRVLTVLGVLTVAAIVSAFVVQPLGYVAAGVMVVVLGLYLTFLRRAVRAEQIRHAQRAARQRRRRAEDARVEKARSEPGYVTPPARLRRPGGAIVLEIDDEDPVFEHLPTYDFAYGQDYDTDYDDVAHRTAV